MRVGVYTTASSSLVKGDGGAVRVPFMKGYVCLT